MVGGVNIEGGGGGGSWAQKGAGIMPLMSVFSNYNHILKSFKFNPHLRRDTGEVAFWWRAVESA